MRLWRAGALAAAVMLLTGAISAGGGHPAQAAPKAPKESKYVWTRVTTRAVLPGGAHFPVFVNGSRAYALHPEGAWSTTDGRTWRSEPLADSGLNTAYLSYVHHDGAVYSLGTMKGSYTSFVIDPVIKKTTDFRSWEVVGRANLPQRVFYSAVSFRGSMWLLGGDDGNAIQGDVWRSEDGLSWTRVTAKAPWAPRTGGTALVFRNKLWMIGGSDERGPVNDVWFTTDGKEWIKATEQISPERPFGYTAAVYDNKLWLMAVDAEGASSGRVLVSDNGADWRVLEAPWSARSGVAAWVVNDSIYIAGGTFAGQGDTVYSRDVWKMGK